ncbi:MAG: beta-lactamase family protein [Pseudomonadales bacterium]|nr:beta-lactamase family protein [Pseudomonadales bacterium]
MTPISNAYDLSEMHEAIQSYIDRDLLVGASSVILKNNEIVDTHCWGMADREAGKPVALDTIMRIYSNTKIVTSVAAMCLWEDGCFDLDDPLAKYLPQLADRQVLKAGSQDPADTEPAASQPTVRQVMCHNAGFSYGFLMESPLDQLYVGRNVMDPDSTLAQLIDKLEDMPLCYHPGARWQYSVSTDILARLVEVWSGKAFDEFLRTRIFGPLGMTDTGFWVPESSADRFAANYVPVDPMAPMTPGLNLAPDATLGGYLAPKSFLSGGGGLVSTIGDYTTFIQMLVGHGEYEGNRILKPETVAMMQTNQLPAGVAVQLPAWVMPSTEFGLGLALKTGPMEGEPESAIGEYHWGGMAGTHTWVAPRAGIAALIFTQRLPGFWHPFSHEYKRLVYKALG